MPSIHSPNIEIICDWIFQYPIRICIWSIVVAKKEPGCRILGTDKHKVNPRTWFFDLPNSCFSSFRKTKARDSVKFALHILKM